MGGKQSRNDLSQAVYERSTCYPVILNRLLGVSSKRILRDGDNLMVDCVDGLVTLVFYYVHKNRRTFVSWRYAFERIREKNKRYFVLFDDFQITSSCLHNNMFIIKIERSRY